MSLVLLFVGIPLILFGLSKLFIAYPTITELLQGVETLIGYVSSIVFWITISATAIYMITILKNRKSKNSDKQRYN